MMPGNSVSPACSLRTRLSRTSCLTDRVADRTPLPKFTQGSNGVRHATILSGDCRRPCAIPSSNRGTSAGLRPSGRRGACAGEHDRRIRQWARHWARTVSSSTSALSRDGVVVVHHDATLDRTTNRPDRSTRWMRASWRGSTRDIDSPRRAPARFAARASAFRRWRDVLRRYRDRRVIVEMKVNSAEFAAAVVDVVRAADAVDRVCLGSFGRRVLARGPAPRAGPRDERGARGSAVGALPVVVPVAGETARRTPATRCPNARKRRVSSRRAFVRHVASRPGSASRSGPWTPRRMRDGSWIGEWTG